MMNATVAFGAVKHIHGPRSSAPAKVYAAMEVQKHFALSELPSMRGLPGVDMAPSLVAGSTIRFSSFNGSVAMLQRAFLKEDLIQAAATLAHNHGGATNLTMVPAPAMAKLKANRDIALSNARIALHTLKQAVHEHMVRGKHAKAIRRKAQPQMARPSQTLV